MLEDWIASFIRDDLGFFLSMCIGVMSAGHNLKKRPMLWLKILLYTLVMFSWGTIFFARTVRGWPGYLVAFAITFVWTLLLFECRPLTALYCVTAAYCLEHIAQQQPQHYLSASGHSRWMAAENHTICYDRSGIFGRLFSCIAGKNL